MPDVRCGNCNTLLQPRHYEMGKCFNCDNSIKNYEKVLLRNEGNFLKKMLLTFSSIIIILFLYGFISIYGSSIKESISNLYNSSSSNSSSSCKLDKMCDEYQKLAGKLITATNSGNYEKVININQDIQNWVGKWEGAVSSNACSPSELQAASNRMLSIANSLMSASGY